MRFESWPGLNAGVSAFTWCQPDGALASPINLIGCPYVWFPHVSSGDILPCPFSHHCVLSFSWVLPDSVSWAPGLCKLNLAVVDEDDYVSLMTGFCFFSQRCQSSFSSLTRWWHAGKSHIKRLSINTCKKHNECKNAEHDVLNNLVAHLIVHVDSGRLSFLSIYLSALGCEVARGAQVRAQERWAEEGESLLAYFFRLDKKHATDRYILALRGDDRFFRYVTMYIFLVTLLPVLNFLRMFLWFFLFTKVRPARAFSVRESALRVFRVWLVERPMAVMAFPWNFI